ncbi:hypothetical protein BGZ67_006671 [Mortierella alpina]|nr:hypothetical protein BGZ67_006671 [Mortierella alpina]
MTLQKGSALDSSLDVRNTTESTESTESTTQLESFPPLALTRSHVLNSPSLGREAVDPIGVPPAESYKRWWILSLSCLLLFGNYFAYDNPAALNTQLQKYLDMPYNDYQYLLSTLYSVYSLPNTVLPFFFGSLVDKFGPQTVLLGLSSCVCIGQTIFSIGVQSRRVWMMLVGRAIFGIGGESCGVAQASITTMQFKGHELAFALGLNLCIARFGSVVNTLITPWAEQRWGVPTAIWIGTLSCVASFMSAVVLVNVIDPPRKQHVLESTETTALTPLLATVPGAASSNTLHRADSTNTADCASSPSSFAHSPTQSSKKQQLPGPLRRGVSFSDSIHSAGLTGGHGKARMRPSLNIVTDQSYGGGRQDSFWQSWWNDLKVFPLTFWLICALTVLLYGTVVPFNNIASDFLQSKWYPGNPRKATAVMGIPDTLGAVLVPGFGMLVDRYGSRASTLIASALIMVIVHSTLGFTTLSPVYAFTLLGVAYSIVVTNELHLGKGYGISSSFLNISLTLVPPIVATIRVAGDSFLPVEMFFISMGLSGMLVGFVLKTIDRRSGGALEQPEIRVEVPVLVPQANIPSTSVSESAVTSPVLSQGRPAFARRRQRPALSCIQTTGRVSGLGLRRVESLSEECGPTLSRRSENDDSSPYQELDANSDNELQTANNTSHQTASRTNSSPETRRPLILPISPMTERNRRRWFGERRPLLRRTLTRVGSPLLQQYARSPRYGSFSSPSLASVSAGDHAFYWGSEDIESRLPGSEAFVEDYSVSQHPILYNPLRGSSGSFRISRSARPVVFSESEDGLVYVDEQAARGSDCDDDGDTMSGTTQHVNASLQHTIDIVDDDDTESTTVTSSNNGDVKDAQVEIDARQDDKH